MFRADEATNPVSFWRILQILALESGIGMLIAVLVRFAGDIDKVFMRGIITSFLFVIPLVLAGGLFIAFTRLSACVRTLTMCLLFVVVPAISASNLLFCPWAYSWCPEPDLKLSDDTEGGAGLIAGIGFCLFGICIWGCIARMVSSGSFDAQQIAVITGGCCGLFLLPLMGIVCMYAIVDGTVTDDEILNIHELPGIGLTLALLVAGPCTVMGMYSVQCLRHRAMHSHHWYHGDSHQPMRIPSIKFKLSRANLNWLDECGVTTLCIAVYVLQVIGVLAYPCTLRGRAVLLIQTAFVPLVHLATATQVISYNEYQRKVNRCVWFGFVFPIVSDMIIHRYLGAPSDTIQATLMMILASLPPLYTVAIFLVATMHYTSGMDRAIVWNYVMLCAYIPSVVYGWIFWGEPNEFAISVRGWVLSLGVMLVGLGIFRLVCAVRYPPLPLPPPPTVDDDETDSDSDEGNKHQRSTPYDGHERVSIKQAAQDAMTFDTLMFMWPYGALVLSIWIVVRVLLYHPKVDHAGGGTGMLLALVFLVPWSIYTGMFVCGARRYDPHNPRHHFEDGTDLHLGEDAWHNSRWRRVRAGVVTVLAWLMSTMTAGLGDNYVAINSWGFFATVSFYVPFFMVYWMYVNLIRQLTAQLGVGPLIHRFAMPFTTIFTVFPLGVYMPIVMAMSEDYENWLTAQEFVMFGCFQIVVAVGAVTMALNEKLKRLEAEKQAKKVVFAIRLALRREGVVSSASIIRLVYDTCLHVGTDETRKHLEKADLLVSHINSHRKQEVVLLETLQAEEEAKEKEQEVRAKREAKEEAKRKAREKKEAKRRADEDTRALKQDAQREATIARSALTSHNNSKEARADRSHRAITVSEGLAGASGNTMCGCLKMFGKAEAAGAHEVGGLGGETGETGAGECSEDGGKHGEVGDGASEGDGSYRPGVDRPNGTDEKCFKHRSIQQSGELRSPTSSSQSTPQNEGPQSRLPEETVIPDTSCSDKSPHGWSISPISQDGSSPSSSSLRFGLGRLVSPSGRRSAPMRKKTPSQLWDKLRSETHLGESHVPTHQWVLSKKPAKEFEKAYAKTRLPRIFEYYAAGYYGLKVDSRTNRHRLHVVKEESVMTHFEWRRFCIDSKLCGPKLSASHVDLIFMAVTRGTSRSSSSSAHWKMLSRRMNYERFRRALALFSKELYPNNTKKQRMAKLRKHIFENAVHVPLAHSTNKFAARMGNLINRDESSYHHDWRARLESIAGSDPTMEELLDGAADDIAEEIHDAPFVVVAVILAVACITITVAMVTVGAGAQPGALTAVVLIVGSAVALVCRRCCKCCEPEQTDEVDEEDEEDEEPAEEGGFFSDLQVHKQEVRTIRKLERAAEEEKAKAARPSCVKAIKKLLFPEPEGDEHLGEAEMELRLMQIESEEGPGSASAEDAASSGDGAKRGSVASGDGKEAPALVMVPWERISEIIMEPLQREKDELDTEVPEIEMSLNSSNAFAFIAIFQELYTNLSVAFRPEGLVAWGMLGVNTTRINRQQDKEVDDGQMVVQIVQEHGEGNVLVDFFSVAFFEIETSDVYNSYPILILCTVFTAVIFVPYSIPATKMISKGTFGEDENGNEPAAFTKLWLYEKGLNLIGASLFVPIITTLLSVLGCDYEADPPVVLRDESIACWEGIWFLYALLALVGLVTYYPVASFLVPNLQFKNKALDLKWNPSFMVLLLQIKLVQSSVIVFYGDAGQREFHMLLWAMLIMYSFTALHIHMSEPCLVKKINRLHACCFLAAAIAVACTLLVFNFEGTAVRVAALILLIVLWVVVVALALHIDARICGDGAGSDDGRVLPIFGAEKSGEEQAAAGDLDLDDDGQKDDETLTSKVQSKLETAKECWDEYGGEFIGNGDIASWGAKGMKMIT